MTERELRCVLAQRSEHRNLDFKRSMDWGAAAAQEKAAIVKDILAMSNTHGGGCIVFGVRDQDFEALGLSKSEFESFDLTKLSDFVNCYADPFLECGVQKFILDGKRFVVIEVSEFRDVPVVCKADLNDKSNRQVLRKGATYIRTQRASSEIVSTAEVMRDLIDRSIAKRGDQFIKMIDQVLAGHPNRTSAALAERDKALSQLERSYDITLQLLGEVLDEREGSSIGHSRRVTAFTMAIGRAMGLPKEQVAIIARAAFLHDVGKITLPDGILHKRSALTKNEIAVMKKHCERGARIVRRIPFLADAAEIVHSHHENYDGTGYPSGLKGKEIPLGARIVALANALDSMVTDSPYRKAVSFSAARAEIERYAGRQFDPEIFNVYEQMPDELFEELRRSLSSKKPM